MNAGWRAVLRRYFGFVLLANLAWEAAHLPLYTAWSTKTPAFLAFAVAHCTLGDLLIAAAALALSLLVVARERWPAEGYARRSPRRCLAWSTRRSANG